ncbi:13867_t:CDS:2, partial [Gigaspora margarita]
DIVKFLYDLDKGSEAICKGLRMLQEDDFANINATWSTLDYVIYTSTMEAGISFEIFNYFDAVIGITNIATLVYIECIWDKIANCYVLNLSPAVETYIKVKYQKHLLAKYFSKILCSLIAINAPDITLYEAETLKLNPEYSFANNMTLQYHYLWRTYASDNIGDKNDI